MILIHFIFGVWDKYCFMQGVFDTLLVQSLAYAMYTLGKRSRR